MNSPLRLFFIGFGLAIAGVKLPAGWCALVCFCLGLVLMVAALIWLVLPRSPQPCTCQSPRVIVGRCGDQSACLEEIAPVSRAHIITIGETVKLRCTECRQVSLDRAYWQQIVGVALLMFTLAGEVRLYPLPGLFPRPSFRTIRI